MKLLITGANGLLGSNIARAWRRSRPGDDLVALTRADVDLGDVEATRRVVGLHRPDAIIHTAAFVAGVGDKVRGPHSFLAENLRLDDAILSAAEASEVPEFLYVSSAVVYPADAVQPVRESALLSGPLEEVNEGYGLAKIVGAKRCEYVSRERGWSWRAVMPSNLYGPGDDYRPGRSHLVASALRKTLAAARSGSHSVEVWGDGTARRELTYAPDLADWLVDQVGRTHRWPSILNAGSGFEATVREVYERAAAVAGFHGRLAFDASQPSGIQRRLLDSSGARELGWQPTTSFADGLHRCLVDLRERALV